MSKWDGEHTGGLLVIIGIVAIICAVGFWVTKPEVPTLRTPAQQRLDAYHKCEETSFAYSRNDTVCAQILTWPITEDATTTEN